MSAETEARQQQVAAMFAHHGPAYRWWEVLTVMLGTVSAIMEATVVNVALPEIIRVFQVGHDQVQLLSTGFLAATTASMLLATWAMQRFGVPGVTLLALFLEGRERQLDAVHGLQPMQEGFFLIPAWLMTGRGQGAQSAQECQ